MSDQPSKKSAVSDSVGHRVAQQLLDIDAVAIRPEQPFVLTSGLYSPVYVDCRKVIAFPKQRRIIIDEAIELLKSKLDINAIDAIAGGETAGIPYAAWIADRLDKPMLYVRKKPKGFGRNAQIEGAFNDGARVLLVEDLATDGGSKEIFINALRQAGAIVNHAFVVFFYNSHADLKCEKLDRLGVELLPLATWPDILDIAETGTRFSQTTVQEIRNFLKDKSGWSVAHGGPK